MRSQPVIQIPATDTNRRKPAVVKARGSRGFLQRSLSGQMHYRAIFYLAMGATARSHRMLVGFDRGQ
jgi:hypothetical protein